MNVTWNLDSASARLLVSGDEASLVLDRPDDGLTNVKTGGREIVCCLLGVEIPAMAKGERSLEDAYVRGSDLIATYVRQPASDVRAQIYWRALEAEGAMGIEVIVSIQTSLLDGDPRIVFHSNLPGEYCVAQLTDADEFQSFDPSQEIKTDTRSPNDGRGCFLFKGSKADFCYAEMIHPADFDTANLSSDCNALQTRYELLPLRMEKGVILRCRAQGWFLPAESAKELAARRYRRFAESKVPLTA